MIKPNDNQTDAGAEGAELGAPMTAAEKSAASLGWPELLKALAKRAAGGPGRRLCREPVLYESAAACDQALAETEEMVLFYHRGDPPPGAPIEDVAAVVETARAGGMLAPEILVQIMDLLEYTRTAVTFFKTHPEAQRLGEWAGQLDDLAFLRKALERCLDRDGTILDSASPELSSLRSRRRVLNERIHRRLAELVAKNPETVLQDSFYTQRSQRYVLPVKASARQGFEGIVHDSSASGQTVFVEPAELVEPNNRLKLTDAEIEEEIIRVLLELSGRVAEYADVIIMDQRVLAHLDFVRARARLAEDLRATRPVMNDAGRILLRNARHPLLALRGLAVIGNDVELGRDARVVVVSGPNAGGKTVGLTMLGLLALMARAGMFVPADPDSEVAVCPLVFAAIGDEQDLARDLSSFAGHLQDLKAILAEAGANSLVLLDELMSSTDPEEGAALAMAVLAALRDRNALVMTTTHLPGLKSFAHEQPGFQNASYSLDPDSLAPTYRLVTGLPGRSMGIEMAARLGLPDGLIRTARARMDDSALRLESLLAELSERLTRLSEDGLELEKLQAEAESRAREYQILMDRARERENEVRRKSGERVQEALRSTESELEAIMKELRERETKTTKHVSSAKQKLEALKERARDESRPVAGDSEELDWSRVKSGLKVKVLPLGIEAEIVDVPGGEIKPQTPITVKMGQMKVRLEAARIRAWPKAKERPGEKVLQKKPARAEEPKRRGPVAVAAAPDSSYNGPLWLQTKNNTLDLRGLRAHEAEARVEAMLDHAAMNNIPNVFIIHGHGTGALKQMIREMLAESPYVDSFRPGERNEGGDGVTMAQLKIQVG